MEHAGYEDLNIAYLDTSENFGIAVSRGESILVEILNKAIRQMDNTVLTSTWFNIQMWKYLYIY
ncbi:MAG: hypothetical protein ACLR0U_17065 [Enterocloster clostridioformis]